MVITKELAIMALRKFPELSSEMYISSQLMDSYRFVLKHGRTRASTLASASGIATCTARMQLLTLYKKGYIWRDERAVLEDSSECVYYPMFMGD